MTRQAISHAYQAWVRSGKADYKLRNQLHRLIMLEQGKRGQETCQHSRYHDGFGMDALICQRCYKILRQLEYVSDDTFEGSFASKP